MQLIEQFIQERVYLKGVSAKTVIWYQNSFKAFDGNAFDGALASKQWGIRANVNAIPG
jgi:hypothetical protein